MAGLPIDYGVDLQASGRVTEWSPLAESILFFDHSAVEFLLKRGANSNEVLCSL
jgi:hypothetical protein